MTTAEQETTVYDIEGELDSLHAEIRNLENQIAYYADALDALGMLDADGNVRRIAPKVKGVFHSKSPCINCGQHWSEPARKGRPLRECLDCREAVAEAEATAREAMRAKAAGKDAAA